MATNRIEVELGISADVSAAKRSISNLEDSLSKLYKKQEQNGFQDLGLNEAVKTAKELEVCLSRALNQKTGKLDISAFQNSLKTAGLSMDQLNQKLLSAGSAGQQVFASLASSIAQAEIPLKRTNKLVSEFTRSIKNVFTYQISASMFQAVTSALSDAVNYTKDLNASLNDIRIVTGQSSAQMAKFAAEANKSAQKLSTTTNNYTKASLIFYQQGLSDAEVKKRTDAVVKMANVTKESMNDVSSYMTAIWNNFDDGSESLEHYADVMTALGAATASSTKEIAAGLEKFASIGKTIGLSYEYATSAVATIVDKTRQSAETVGTGLRTIFSRLQGLSLGETLEDGVDLNKYSSALKTVGVNILDASGNMKEMDSILDSLAVKWGNLSNAQKTALAQTVGGVRQYTTLISLMDNWDSMKQNLNTANTADGSLQKQQDIYAEGWEAAAQRSKAALEELYQTLLNDKGFIALTDGLTTVTKAVTSLVSAMGGLPGILSTVGMIATKVFSKQITQGVRGATDKLTTWGSQFKNQGFWKSAGQIIRGESQSAAQVKANQAFEAQERSQSATMKYLKDKGKQHSIEYMAAEQATTLIGRKRKLMENSGRLTEDEQKRAQDKINALGKAQERRLALRQEKEQQAVEFSKLEDNAISEFLAVNTSQGKGKRKSKKKNQTPDQHLKNLYDLAGLTGTGAFQVEAGDDSEKRRNNLQGMITTARGSARNQALADDYLGMISKGALADPDQRKSAIKEINTAFGTDILAEDADLDAVETKLQEISQQAAEARAAMDDLIKISDTDSADQKNAKQKIKELLDKAGDQGSELASRDKEEGHVAGEIKGFEEDVDGILNGEQLGDKLAAGLEKVTAVVGGLVTGFTQAKSAMEVLGDTSASIGDQISAGMSVASGAVTAFVTGGPWAAVAYLVGVVGSIAVDALIKQFNAAEIAAQKAEAVSASLSAAADEAASHLNAISSAVDGYEGAIETLNSCTKGTQEWSDALKNVHSSISGLLTEFPQLLEYSNLFNTDGTLNQDVLDQAVETAKIASVAADAAAIEGQVAAKQARLEANVVSQGRDYTGYLAKTDIQGNLYYESYNTGYKEVGNQATVKGDLAKVLNSYSTFGSEALELTDIYAALGTEMGDNSTITEEYAKSLLNLANQSVAATTMMDNAAKSIISDWATANGTDLITGQSEFMTATYNAAVKTFKEAVEEASDQNNKHNNKDYSKLGTAFDNTSFKGMSVTEAFNHARGTNYELASNGVRGVDDNRTYVYLENGEEKTYKMEEMQATIAAAAALEQMGDAAAKAKGKIANISNNLAGSNATDEEKARAQIQEVGLQNYLASKNLESMTESDFTMMQGTVTSMGGASAYLQQAFGMTEEEITNAFGEDFITNFENTLTRTKTAWADAWGNNKDVAVEALGEVTNEMSLSNVAKLSNYMDEFSLGPAGAEAGAQFVEGLNKMIEGIDPEQQQAALTDLLTTVDWTSYDAFNQAQVILKKYGITINETDAYWKDFVADMRLAAGAMPDFSKIKTDLNSVSEIVKDLKFGDIIDEKDYQTLIAYNDEWERFFLLQADGSRQFVGNEKDFNKFIQEKTIANREEINLRRTVSKLEGIGDVKWSEGGDAAKAAFDEYMKNDSFKALMDTMGYTSDMTSSMTAEQLTEMYTRIGEAVNANQIELDQSEFEQMIASMATSFEDLNTLYKDGTIGTDAYSRALLSMASGYEYCTSAIKDYQKAVASGVGVDEAREALEKAVAAEQAAEKYSSAYSNALSGKDSMSVADLNALEEANPDLYYQYLSASEEEWYEASYQAYMAWLDARIAGYATDSAEYKALMAEKQQLEDEHYEKLEEKALKEKEQQDAIWEKQRSGAESALGTISSNLLSTDSLSFENIAELEATLRQAGIDSERIQTILANLNAGDSADDIKKKVAAAMEVAFAGMATDAEKAKEYNTLMSITDVKIDESVYQKLGDITKVTLAPDGSLISAYLTSLKQDPAKKTITFIGETGEEYTTTYTNCTADGSTRTITFTGTQGETYTTTFTLCTVGADKTITFIGSKGEKYTSTFNECTASGATKTITFKGDDGEYTTKLVSVTQDAANKTITFVGATGETYTSTYNSCVLGADKKITFTGAEGTTYTDLVTSCTAGADKTITLHGENGNYTTKYAEIVGGTPGLKTITLMLEGGAEGQQSALQVEVDKIGLNGKTITYTGDFGQIEEALKSYGLGTGDDGNVTMDVTGESGYTETAEVAGVQLAMGQLTFTTNLGTIQGEVDNLQADLASLPADYPVTVTLKDGSTTTITAKELQQFTTAKGVDMNAVVNYLEGSGGDLVKDREINVTVNYKAQRAAALREVFLDKAGDTFLSTFDSGEFLGRVKTGHSKDDKGKLTDRGTATEFGDWWIRDTNKQKGEGKQKAIAGTALQIEAGAIEAIQNGDIEGLQALQDFIDGVNQVDPAVGAQLQLMLDSVVEADESISRTKDANGEYVYALATQPPAETTQPAEATTGSSAPVRTIETVTDQDALNGAAGATYTQATVAFQAYDWKQIGTDVVEGITSGINEGLANFNPGNWNPAAAATEDAARGAYLTHSPSRLMIPIGHDVVAGVETGIAEGLSDADTGDWTAYALATFAEADGAFKDIGNDGIEGIVKNALLTDLAEYDQDASSIMTIGDDGLYRYNTSTILGQAFASNDENNANLNWYNKYGQFINTEAEDGGWSTFLAWHKQKQTKNANGEVMTEDEIKAMWDQRFSQMTTIDGHEVMNDYMAEFWKNIADTTVTEIEGISGYQRGVMVDVYNRAIKELGKDATGAEITAKMQEIINEEGILLQESAVKAWGQIKDIMVNGSVAIVQNEQAAAKEVYEAWVSTFEAISSARLNLMDKTTGSLLSEMKGDSQKLKDIYMKMLTGGVGWDTIFSMMTATGADKSQYMQYFNYTPFDLAHYKQSSNVGYLNWNGDPTNGFMGLNTTTAADFMSNINTLLAPKLTGNTYDFFQEYLTPEKLATMSDAEASVLMQKGIINKTALGYQLVDANTFKGLGTLGNDFFVEMLAQILGMDKSLFTYDSSTGKFSIANGKTEEVNKEVNELTATAMVDTSTANQERADQITAENKIAIDAKAKELELLEKARDNGVESLDEAEKAQLRSYLGLAENADLSSVSLDTLTGAAADAAAALGLLSKSAQTDEYMALKGYTKDQSGNYVLDTTGANTTDTSDDSDMVKSMLASGYKYFEGTDGQSYYAKTDSAGNVIDGSQIQVVITPEAAAAMAAGYKTGDTTIDDAASGKTETQTDADNRLALAKAAGFASFQEQDDYIAMMEAAGKDTTNHSDGGMLTAEEIMNRSATDEIDTLEEAIDLQREYANQLALMEQGLAELNQNGKEWLKTLKSENKSMAEKAKILPQLKKSYQKILNLSDKFVNDEKNRDFFLDPKNLELAQKAAEKAGKEGQAALDELQARAVTFGKKAEELNTIVGETGKTVSELATALSQLSKYDIGEVLTGSDASWADAYWDHVVETAVAGGASLGDAITQANADLGTLGIDVDPGFEVVKENVPAETLKTDYVLTGTDSFDIINPDGTVTTVTGDNFEQVTSGLSGTVPITYIKGKNGSKLSTTSKNTAPVTGGENVYTKGAEKPGGGGRGGGGGGSRRRYLAKAKPEDHKERYHEINNALDDVSDALERLNEQQDRAWGSARIKAMQQEAELLKEQTELYHQKRKEAEEYLKTDRKKAEEAGWTFDENGNVSNYEERLNAVIAEYNQKIEEYNAMSAQEQEAKEKLITEANERFEKGDKDAEQYLNPETGVAFGSYEEYLKYTFFDAPKKALETYEGTMEEWEEIQKKILTNLYTEYDNYVEQIKYTAENMLEFIDDQIKYIEHKLSRMEDNAYKTAESIELIASQIEASESKIAVAEQELATLLGAHKINVEDFLSGKVSAEDLKNAGFTDAEIEELRNIMTTAQDAEKDMSETLTKGIESMSTAFESFNAELDRYTSSIEHAQSITSTYRNILDLTGKSLSGFSVELLKAFNESTIEQAKANMSANKTKYETVQVEYDKALQVWELAQAQYAAGLMEDSAYLQAKKTFEDTEDALQEAQESYISSWEAAIQAVADAYQSTMEAVIEDVSKKLANGMTGGLDALSEYMDRAKTTESNYVDDYEKIYQLTKLTRDLDSKIDNTQNVKTQKELLKFQKEINALLQSDKQLSEYDIDYLQKKYDLKLAEIALEDAQNAKSQVTMRRDSEGNYNYVYTADENAVAEAEAEYEGKLYEMQKANDEYITSLSDNIISLEQEMLQAIGALDPAQFASEEDYNNRVADIIKFYTEQMEYQSSEMGKVLANNKSLYDNDMKWYAEYRDYKMADAATFLDSWDKILLAQVSGFSTQEEFFNNFKQQAGSLANESLGAYATWAQKIGEINTSAGTSTGTLGEDIGKKVQELTDDAKDAAEKMETSAGKIKDSVTGITGAVIGMLDQFEGRVGAAADKVDLLTLSIMSLFKTLGVDGFENLQLDGKLSELWLKIQATEGAKPTAATSEDGPDTGYDTGGYTGSWGTEGRLAFLHQKELVLNAHDTENMLASVGILRQIASVIDLNALTSAGGFANLISSGISHNREPLQQEVHIEAHFPNATDKNQIEEAFKDIVNLASQYANSF